MSFKLVIFDCDGVLVDSERLSNHALADMLALHGYDVCGDDLESRFRGVELNVCLEILQKETGKNLPSSFEAELRQHMSCVFESQLRPIKGVARLIESMRIPFCVASNGPRMKVESNLKITKLYSDFSGKVFSAYDHGSWKPDPGLFLAAAKYFGVAPQDCVVIEDSAVGVSAGVAAKMTVYALNTTSSNASFPGASHVFQTVDELYDAFLSQNLLRINSG